jgi:hypothetical protein
VAVSADPVQALRVCGRTRDASTEAIAVRYNFERMGCMQRFAKTRAGFGIVAALACVLPMMAQSSAIPSLRLTTQERMETEPWWPTMATAPLASYAGSPSCTNCHHDESAAHATGMQRAATRAASAHFLPDDALIAYLSGDLSYTLARHGDAITYSVARGREKISDNLDWVMGAGALARTFLYQAGGRWYQSETSYYTQPAAMDITTGFGPSKGRSLNIALGNLLTPAEARTCFNCHTVHATTSAGLDPLHAETGIGCEACHGPGARHVAAMTAKARSGTVPAELRSSEAIFSPSRLSPADSIDFCGACHRSFADANLSTGPSADRAVVRFQPYRLEESKCWRATQDARLTCVACHNPHQPLNRDPTSYDHNCLQCHAGAHAIAAGASADTSAHAAAVCPRATHDCVSCHMPKVELPSMHGSFTDHFIRIARAGEPLPR